MWNEHIALVMPKESCMLLFSDWNLNCSSQVLQIESIITNIQNYAIEVCQLLNSLLPSMIVASTSTSIEVIRHIILSYMIYLALLYVF